MTYEYACEACGHHWEAEQSIKDPPLKSCAACGKKKAKRLVSGGTGFLLKGGGWYADGYGSKPAPSTTSGEAPAVKASSGTEGAEGGGNSDTKSEGTAKNEAKPAAATETAPAKSPEPAPKPTSTPSTPKAKAS